MNYRKKTSLRKRKDEKLRQLWADNFIVVLANDPAPKFRVPPHTHITLNKFVASGVAKDLGWVIS